MAERGVPQAIRCDNGPELTSRHFLAWCIERQIELVHIKPGKPTQNGRVELYSFRQAAILRRASNRVFNGRLREECLNLSWFQIPRERPHSSLGYKTPKATSRKFPRSPWLR